MRTFSITYERERQCLLFDYDLYESLFCPEGLYAVPRADGLVLTMSQAPGAVALRIREPEYWDGITPLILSAPTEATEVTEAAFDDYHALISPQEAAALRLRPGAYTAWLDVDEIIAVPADTLASGTDELTTVSVTVRREELMAIELLAMRYGVRARDVLAAFVEDLVGSPGSGGSDERDMAEAWFERNADPDPEDGTGRPSFMRGPDYSTKEGGDGQLVC